jgi:hypothetical protein
MSRAALGLLTFICPYWRLIFLAFGTDIQFILSSLFSVFGQKGYALRKELVDLKHAFDTREKHAEAIYFFATMLL